MLRAGLRRIDDERRPDPGDTAAQLALGLALFSLDTSRDWPGNVRPVSSIIVMVPSGAQSLASTILTSSTRTNRAW